MDRVANVSIVTCYQRPLLNKRYIIPKVQSKMDNPETLTIPVTQNTGRRQTTLNKRQRIPKEQSQMDNPETLAT